MPSRLQWRQFACAIPPEVEIIAESGNDNRGRILLGADRLTIDISWQLPPKALTQKAELTEHDPWLEETETVRKVYLSEHRIFQFSARGSKCLAEAAHEMFEGSLEERMGAAVSAWEMGGLAFTAPAQLQIHRWSIAVGRTSLDLRHRSVSLSAQRIAPWATDLPEPDLQSLANLMQDEVSGNLRWVSESEGRIESKNGWVAMRQDMEGFFHTLSVRNSAMWGRTKEIEACFLF